MTLKEVMIVFLIMTAMVGVTFGSGIVGKIAESGRTSDRIAIAAANTEYFYANQSPSFRVEGDSQDFNQLDTILHFLTETGGLDAEYVKENFKEIDVTGLIQSRYLSRLNNKDLVFVGHKQYLDIVLTIHDLEENLEFVLAAVSSESLNLEDWAIAWVPVEGEVKKVLPAGSKLNVWGDGKLTEYSASGIRGNVVNVVRNIEGVVWFLNEHGTLIVEP